MQQDNDTVHSSKSKRMAEKEKHQGVHWLSQSPDQNSIEMLCQDLKKMRDW